MRNFDDLETEFKHLSQRFHIDASLPFPRQSTIAKHTFISRLQGAASHHQETLEIDLFLIDYIDTLPTEDFRDLNKIAATAYHRMASKCQEQAKKCKIESSDYIYYRRQAFVYIKKAVDLDPENHHHKHCRSTVVRNLLLSLNRLTELKESQENYTEAQKFYEEYLKIYDQHTLSEDELKKLKPTRDYCCRQLSFILSHKIQNQVDIRDLEAVYQAVSRIGLSLYYALEAGAKDLAKTIADYYTYKSEGHPTAVLQLYLGISRKFSFKQLVKMHLVIIQCFEIAGKTEEQVHFLSALSSYYLSQKAKSYSTEEREDYAQSSYDYALKAYTLIPNAHTLSKVIYAQEALFAAKTAIQNINFDQIKQLFLDTCHNIELFLQREDITPEMEKSINKAFVFLLLRMAKIHLKRSNTPEDFSNIDSAIQLLIYIENNFLKSDCMTEGKILDWAHLLAQCYVTKAEKILAETRKNFDIIKIESLFTQAIALAEKYQDKRKQGVFLCKRAWIHAFYFGKFQSSLKLFADGFRCWYEANYVGSLSQPLQKAYTSLFTQLQSESIPDVQAEDLCREARKIYYDIITENQKIMHSTSQLGKRNFYDGQFWQLNPKRPHLADSDNDESEQSSYYSTM